MNHFQPIIEALLSCHMPADQRPPGIKKPGLITGKGGQESNYRDCRANIEQMYYIPKYG
jgi:hypothetical protein